MKYRRVTATRIGPPEVLEVTEHELRAPSQGEVRIKVLAASVCRPDVTARNGQALFSGTPLGQKPPFVPGYAVIGDVDVAGEGVTGAAVGDRVGVLTVIGGYSEYLYWRSDWLIPVPMRLDPAEAVTLLLNYLVAYQTLHRSAKVKAGDKVLIIGASGGIGTALLQLGRLANLKMYGIASKAKHAILTEMGATPIDYHTQSFVEVLHEAEPDGLDVVIDGMNRVDYIQGGLSLLRRGGRMVSYGEPAGLGTLLRILGILIRVNLLPNGKSFKLYGTSSYSLFDKRPFLEDWATLFKLLEEGKIKPVIAQKFPILEAAKANQLLEGGTVTGNVVLVTPELL
jgi:NADPH:quinone reductase-like Zn-dependent oxidoreductase